MYRSRCHSLCSGFFSHAAYTYPRPSGETVLYFTFHLFSTSRSFSLLQILPLPFSSRQLNPAEFSWQRTRSSVPKPRDKKHELKQTGDGQSELGGERCVERRTLPTFQTAAFFSIHSLSLSLVVFKANLSSIHSTMSYFL